MIVTKHIFKIADKISQNSNVSRAKISAVAFSPNGHIISYSHNRRILGSEGKWTEHAEISLLKKLDKIKAFQRMGKIYILVTRVCKSGVTIAKPCEECQKELRKYNCMVYYTDRKSRIKKL